MAGRTVGAGWGSTPCSSDLCFTWLFLLPHSGQLQGAYQAPLRLASRCRPRVEVPVAEGPPLQLPAGLAIVTQHWCTYSQLSKVVLPAAGFLPEALKAPAAAAAAAPEGMEEQPVAGSLAEASKLAQAAAALAAAEEAELWPLAGPRADGSGSSQPAAAAGAGAEGAAPRPLAAPQQAQQAQQAQQQPAAERQAGARPGPGAGRSDYSVDTTDTDPSSPVGPALQDTATSPAAPAAGAAGGSREAPGEAPCVVQRRGTQFVALQGRRPRYTGAGTGRPWGEAGVWEELHDEAAARWAGRVGPCARPPAALGAAASALW